MEAFANLTREHAHRAEHNKLFSTLQACLVECIEKKPSDPVFYVAQKLLLTTGKVASINMVNGDLVPVSGGGPAGGGMAAANSLKTSGDDSDSDSGEIVELAVVGVSVGGVDIGSYQLSAAAKTDKGQAALRALFDDLDKDASGKVSSKEWGSSVAKWRDKLASHFGTNSLTAIGSLFSSADSDGDKALSFEEFLALAQSLDQASIAVTGTAATVVGVEGVPLGNFQLMKAVSTPEGREELKGLFDSLDKNSDGKVTGEEWGESVHKFKDVLKKYFGGNTVANVDQLFRSIDANGSGSFTWEEFLQVAQMISDDNA